MTRTKVTAQARKLPPPEANAAFVGIASADCKAGVRSNNKRGLSVHGAPQMQFRLVLLCVTIASYGTQAILAETAQTRMEGAICCLARWRAAGWKNLPEERDSTCY
jgi:hypothetical protein